MKTIYLVLAVAGLVLPYLQFVPFLQENGLDLNLFVEQMFANRIAAFFAWDVIISAVVLLAFIAADLRRQQTRLWWLPILGLCAVGVSFAFPLYLYLRAEDK